MDKLKEDKQISRAVARFFAHGGASQCRKHEGGLGVSSPRKYSEIRFSALMRCLRKIDCEYENGKKLQVTIIKITESKENKFIYRLDWCVSGSRGPRWGRGGQLPPCSPATISVMVFENWSPYQFSKFVFVVCKVLYVKAFGIEIFV